MNLVSKNARPRGLGPPVYAAGVIAIALVNLALGAFDPTQPVPDFPERTILAYLASMFMLIAGLATVYRRTATRGAAALTVYFSFVVTLLMNGRVVVANYSVYGAYFGAIEGLALAAPAFIIFAGAAKLDPKTSDRCARVSRYTFGLCALFFGGAHFVYLDNTVSLVPQWLPPSPIFWAYATGFFHIAAGVALFTNIMARFAMVLLTTMYAAFTPLVHIPLLISDPSKHFFWTENALNVALVGCAWVIADSLRLPDAEPPGLQTWWPQRFWSSTTRRGIP
jgi:uncharacterized membrane protein